MDFTECITPPLISISVPEIDAASPARVLNVSLDTDAMDGRASPRNPNVAIELKSVILKDITDPIAMAVPWDSFQLLQWLNAYMEEMKVAMTADSILGRYSESIKGSAEQIVSGESQQ